MDCIDLNCADMIWIVCGIAITAHPMLQSVD
jgi:hypothetical protein